MQKAVVIDRFPESAANYLDGYAIVAVDVVRATTTAITAVATGRRCFPVSTLGAAFALAKRLKDPLLAGEQRGTMPPGFHINNSPSEIIARRDVERPLVQLSSSGTKLCNEAANCRAAFLACLRNYDSVAAHVARTFPKVAVIGAGSRGEFREEDQMCCAWVAERLVALGYLPADDNTRTIIRRWSGQPIDAWLNGRSAAYLRESGQAADIDFILSHVGDLSEAFILTHGEVIMSNMGLDVRA
jgi:2-phosphosulfolactate phosphatase